MSEPLEDRDVPRPDYALLDRAGASQWMFFPRPDPGPPPPGASDHEIEVAPGINISARLYSGSEEDAPRPLVLYFHGNGEVVSDHDGIDRFYREIGLDLFVAEFRGYGKSGGRPSMAALVGDALPALEYALALQAGRGGGPLFVMGRSMGTQPALEVAARAGDRVRGLIIESGAASARRSIARFGLEDEPGAAEFIEAHEAKVRSIRIPRCRSTARRTTSPRSSWRRSSTTSSKTSAASSSRSRAPATTTSSGSAAASTSPRSAPSPTRCCSPAAQRMTGSSDRGAGSWTTMSVTSSPSTTITLMLLVEKPSGPP